MATRGSLPVSLSNMDRRRFLQLTAGVAATLGLSQLPAGIARAARPPAAYPFTLGVASGDPSPDGFELWTRLAPRPLEFDGGMGASRRPVEVDWQVAADEAMSTIVASETAVAPSELAHSVHVEVAGVEPWREYFYRFRAGEYVSRVGRTKTTPAPGSPLERLRFAFASCQDWQAGFYSAYHRMAEEDLDVVVHLGDYIYEDGIGPTGGARNVSVPARFRTETTRLREYRIRYGLYRTDPDLQEAHRLFPWLVT
jgi:alkaline phosphatase D